MRNLIGHSLSRCPWAVDGTLAYHMRQLLAREGLAGLRHLAELKRAVHGYDDDGGPSAQRGSRGAVGGTVAIVPVIGTLTQRGDVINSVATRSTDEVADEVKRFASDPKVDAVVLEIDSPGGEVFGVKEAFQAIRDARKQKPVVAAVNSYAASAGYWLASAADEIVVTPGGQVGSIGVYALHVDLSEAIKAEGERWTFVSAGKYKVEGNPAEPLGDEARGAMQGQVDAYYADFLRDVARGRRVAMDTVREGFGEGRMVLAQRAVEQRMATSVGTFDQAIRRAVQLGRERRREASEVEDLAALELAPMEPSAEEKSFAEARERNRLEALDRLRTL